ncbi:MAG: hypothetical protein M1814_001639 [Vezdaea aestivalis]|nr:MAG: hypothetical protein M1814_001639 [Vezdaea aestivalis]
MRMNITQESKNNVYRSFEQVWASVNKRKLEKSSSNSRSPSQRRWMSDTSSELLQEESEEDAMGRGRIGPKRRRTSDMTLTPTQREPLINLTSEQRHPSTAVPAADLPAVQPPSINSTTKGLVTSQDSVHSSTENSSTIQRVQDTLVENVEAIQLWATSLNAESTFSQNRIAILIGYPVVFQSAFTILNESSKSAENSLLKLTEAIQSLKDTVASLIETLATRQTSLDLASENSIAQKRLEDSLATSFGDIQDSISLATEYLTISKSVMSMSTKRSEISQINQIIFTGSSEEIRKSLVAIDNSSKSIQSSIASFIGTSSIT